MSSHNTRCYTIYEKSDERHTIKGFLLKRPKWIKLFTRGFPLAEAREVYRSYLADGGCAGRYKLREA